MSSTMMKSFLGNDLSMILHDVRFDASPLPPNRFFAYTMTDYLKTSNAAQADADDVRHYR